MQGGSRRAEAAPPPLLPPYLNTECLWTEMGGDGPDGQAVNYCFVPVLREKTDAGKNLSKFIQAERVCIASVKITKDGSAVEKLEEFLRNHVRRSFEKRSLKINPPFNGQSSL